MNGSLDGTLNKLQSDYLDCVKTKINIKKLQQILEKDVQHWKQELKSERERIEESKTELGMLLQIEKPKISP